jgi:hypothetical protein
MATGPRVTLQPIPLNLAANVGGIWLTSTTAGYDTGSPGGTQTAWSTTLGVMIPNPTPGAVMLAYACGATAAGAWQVLVGDLIGTTGQVAPATDIAGTIAASTAGWLGPWSPATFNQQAPTQVTYAGAINTTALTAAAQGCVVIDFTTTTTLAVRAYSVIPVSP